MDAPEYRHFVAYSAFLTITIVVAERPRPCSACGENSASVVRATVAGRWHSRAGSPPNPPASHEWSAAVNRTCGPVSGAVLPLSSSVRRSPADAVRWCACASAAAAARAAPVAPPRRTRKRRPPSTRRRRSLCTTRGGRRARGAKRAGCAAPRGGGLGFATPPPPRPLVAPAAPSRGVPPRSVRRAATRQAAVARRARRRASARAGAVGAWVFWRPRSSLPAVALVGADRRAEQGGCGLRGLTSPNACADHAGGRRPGGAPARPRRVRRLFRASRRARPPGAGLSPRRWAGYGYVGRGATGRAPGDRPPRLRGRVGRRGAARERAGQTASQRRGGAAVWHQAAAEGGRRDGGRTVLDVRWCGGAGRAAAASTPNRNYTGEC